MPPPRRLPAVLAAVVLFAALAVWPMHLVVQAVGTAIPGPHLGDNAAALWNTWWFTYALEHGQPLYWTGMLFAPAGTQLSLHTHATTHSVLAWPAAAAGSVVAGHNMAILAGLALNGFCAWLLAFRLTGAGAGSLVAGIIFSLSAYIQIHALGHVNLVHAWVLPLFALALMRLDSPPRPGKAIACGVAGAIVVYTDYYFAVYAGIFAMLWLGARTFGVEARRRPARAPRLGAVLLAVLAIDVLLMAAIAFTGGTALDLGFTRLSIRGIRNPLTAFWLLLAVWLVVRHPFRVSIVLRSDVNRRGVRPRDAALTLGTVALLTMPLWLALARVIAAGDYSTQQVLWRSSPAGADLATLLLGNPRHLLWGEAATRLYGDLAIDVMEQSLWLGIVPLTLILASRAAWLTRPGARFWVAVGLVFFLLSLGPFLRVAGVDTGLPLPHALLRYLPVFSNARIPGRAVVMVQLAVAILSAFAFAGIPRRPWIVAAVVGALVLEAMPSRLPAQALPRRDAVDAELSRAAEPGAIVELPVGLRDGFGEVGQLDHRALAHQVWHERPLVGGFVARLPERVERAQLGTPPVASLLALSTPGETVTSLPADAANMAAASGIAHLVVNRDTVAGQRLPRAALEASGFTLVVSDGARELYSTRAAPPR